MTTTDGIPATLEDLKVPVDGLVPYKRNPRRGNTDLIAESLDHNGQYRPIVVRARTNEVLAGNHTLAAAKQLGWEQIAATFVDCTDDQAARIVLVDNRANDVADYDNEELASLLDELGDLDGTGFDEDALAELAEGLDPGETEETPEEIDEAPEVPDEPVTRPGDVWVLGEHRVVCGDATAAEDYEKLMDGGSADCVWTDPPYGVDYTGGTEQALKIQNDGGEDLEALLVDAFTAMIPACRPGAPVYIAHSDTRRVTFEQAAVEVGILVRQNLIWVKNAMVLGHSDYQYKHEPVLYGETGAQQAGGPHESAHDPVLYGFAPEGKGRLGRGGPRWYGPNNATTVFEFPKPPANRDHPTMKPVDLIRAMLSNSCRPSGTVLDPFGGSGSTLLAAHLQGGKARLLELDPKYVDVICRRYQDLTGETPTRDGVGHDFREAADGSAS
ncbi:DNA methyltransferase [Rothia koreensis]|uniref:DNA methyltransferase n=1 Tax=Rothia koreensis TaxID=592378 RepID=UPI0037CC0E2E